MPDRRVLFTSIDVKLAEACQPYGIDYTDAQFDKTFTPRQQAAMAAGKSVIKRHNHGRRSVYRLIPPPEQEPPMPTPTDDALLDFYAQQYADKVNVPLDTARKIVDGRPNMQALLGRVDGDMTYEEACANAGIEVPATVPAARVIAEPEPAEVPAIEVGPGDPAFDAGVDAGVEFIANGLARLELSPNDLVEASLERGYDLTGDEPELARFMAGLDSAYANTVGPVELPVTVMAVTEPPTFDEVVAEVETFDEEIDAALAPVVPIRAAESNTLITLTYRAKDSSTTTTVVNGPPTAEGIERITARLERGLWLIPEQVGLTRPVWPATIDHHDHPWVEVAFTGTSLTAVQSRSFDELVVDIEAVPTWDGATFTPDQEAAA